jgi:hypothetical protein
MRRYFQDIRCLATLLAASLATAGAQQPGGAVKGVVTDSTGAVMPGAVVSLSGPNAQRAMQSRSNGSFDFPELPPGQYTVTASFPGFSVVDKPATVAAGATVKIPIQLSPTSENFEVTVQAEAGPIVDVRPENNAAALVLKGKDLDALPDDPDDLMSALQALAGPGAGLGGGAIYVDNFSGGALPPKESIREVRINQNPFSAEYDKLGYGRIELFTKPGTDKLRGSVFFNAGNAVLDSRNPFSINKPDSSNRMYGGSLSGPLGKRASFFLDVNRRQIDNSAVVYAPNFVSAATLTTVPIQEAFITPLSMTRISPRLDYQLSKKHTLTVRFEEGFSKAENLGIGGYLLPPPYASLEYNSRSDSQNLMASETATLNPKIVNETRFQFYRSFSDLLGNNAQPTIAVSEAFTIGGNQTGHQYDTSQHYELQNNTRITHGAHAIAWGVRLREMRDAANNPSNYGGTFYFFGGAGPVLDANNQPVIGPNGQPETEQVLANQQYYRTLLFQHLGYSPAQIRALGGGASQFVINAGNPFASVSQFDAAPWFQDDWRLRRNVTLSLGLRYEIQTNISDRRDIAPRVAVAWSPFKDTVLRGGFGIFYDRVGEQLVENAQRFNGFNQLSYVVHNPDFFPNVPPLSTLTPSQNSIYRLGPDLRAGDNIQTAMSLERRLPHRTVLALTYTYTRANHLPQTVPINAPIPGTYPAGSPLLGTRPFGDAGNIFEYESGAFLKQNLFMANFNTQFSNRVALYGNYTLNYSSDLPGQPSDPYNFLLDYGRSTLDRRHRFQLVGSITAPLGIRISPFVTLQSGSPYDVLLGTDYYGDTLQNARPAFAASGAPGAICREPVGCFGNPIPGSAIGLVPRNYLTSAGLVSVNARVAKTFSFGRRQSASTPRPGGFGGPRERHGGPGTMGPGPGRGGPFGAMGSPERRYSLTFSVMMINALNHLNPAMYQGNITSPQFGQPTGVNTGFGGGGVGAAASAANNRRIMLQTQFTF